MNDTGTLRLGLIIGSTREGRFAPTVADWFITELGRRPEFDPTVVDVAQLPFEFTHPSSPTKEIEEYRQVVASCDVFVVVAAEYNHGYTAGLKHAIDLAKQQWNAKPVAFVSYGGVSGGLRAVEQLRQVFAELHCVTVRDVVSFHHVPFPFGEDGRPRDAQRATLSAARLLDQLVWWGEALQAARGRQAYPG